MASATFDVIIVGQGLAGSLLAWELIRRGQRVLVVDDGHRTSASRVAAGLVNPLAGMRFNAHPRTPEWLRAMHRTYTEIASALATDPYFHPLPMRRPFRSTGQRRFYERQRDNPLARVYLGGTFSPEDAGPVIRAPFGGFWQSHTGYVALPRLLDDLRAWLIGRHALRSMPLALDRLAPDGRGMDLDGVRAERVVFCEGYRVQHNPWFGWLPMQPDKGEILRLRASRRLTDQIVNGAHWLVPLADGDYRFGATHAHHRIDNQPTPEGRAALESGIERLLADRAGIEITGHAAGVRPATADRHALLGRHPELPSLYVFNGFGARGSLSIPWYAGAMADHLIKGSPLPPEADIGRCGPAS